MTNPSTKGSFLSQPMVKSVLVYRNGDPFFPGRRIVINEKKVSNFEVFLKEVTGGVKAPFGAVRNIYTPRAGHRVRQLEELQSGEQYVAGGREAFKKLNYLDIGETKKKPAEVNNEQSTVEDVKPVTHSRITASARFRKPFQEPYTIFLIANGDIISPVVRLLIPRKTLNHWDHILEMVTAKVSLRSGAVHRLYTLDGKHVQNGSDLEKGQFYVAVGREKFKKLPYGELLFSKSTIRPQGSKASVLPPIAGSRKSKGSGNDRQSKSTVGSSDPGENSSSPQPPKEKVKKCHNPEDSVSRGHSSNKSTKANQTASTRFLQDNGEGIYRAREKQSETWGAAEVQEDEDTRVEVPLDQRPAETVDEEEDAEEEDDRGEEEAYKQKEEHSEVNGEENGETVMRSNRGENKNKLNGNYEHKIEETENVEQAEEEELTHLNGKIDKDSDGLMEQMNSHDDLQHEEDIKEDYSGSQDQVDSHHEKASRNPRVTITSPQESETKDQSNGYAAVA
ncbi:doublecortin domain-containing protein 2 isoform X2 [Phasianus colchicus]|uniref:doublecortin domain-containing protein 2 isoform X2 n=1 Tax=Phasianus colchicus TaxID=9054 RepID=UPI00129E0FB2|nr:doublecortin domain-containing protein 2 isoform X2 [Phasianus colchicus]